MAADTIRTLLEDAFPGDEIGVQDRTGGGDSHLEVVAAAGAVLNTDLVARESILEKRSNGVRGHRS